MFQIFTLPPNHSLWGHHIDELFWLTYYLTGIAFLAVVGILVGCCVLYRERRGHKASYFHGDARIHLLTTGALSALVFLGMDYQLESRGRRAMEAYKAGYVAAEGDVRIQVRGQQFKWYFRYHGPDGKFGTPDDIVSTDLRVPVSEKAPGPATRVAVQIQSRDVIHSFYLPFQRIKQDAVPGITTSAWFAATKLSPPPLGPGEKPTDRLVGDRPFEVACAELCGSGHTNMRNPFFVMTREAWDAWLSEKHQEELDEEDFDMGEEELPDGSYRNWGWKWESRGSITSKVDRASVPAAAPQEAY